MPTEPDVLNTKLELLKKSLAGMPSAALAFSGGVDSSFLLAVMKDVCPGKILAVSVISEFVPGEEQVRAAEFAAGLDVQFIQVPVEILSNKDVVRNSSQRCYHCKLEIFSKIREIASENGINFLLHGVNQDDLSDYRPGLKAASELGFLSPLADAGLSKAEIRAFSKQIGLSSWDLPSQSCLAARIAYGEPITSRKLKMIEAAEGLLHRKGFDLVRVRSIGTAARVEVAPEKVAAASRLLETGLAEQIRQAGFGSVELDPEGYQTGKMNHEILTGKSGKNFCPPS